MEPDQRPQEQAPADPFTRLQTGWMNTVETYRQIRAAGAGWVGGAFLTAAFVIMTNAASQGNDDA